MADPIPQLQAALHAADAAGDTASAQHIAGLIQQAATAAPSEGFQYGNPKPGWTPHHANLQATPADQLDPTVDMGAGDKFAAGMGESAYNTGRGLGQLAGLQDAKDTDAQRALDRPLNHTGMGIAGNVVGSVAQALLPAAAGAKGLALLGQVAPRVAPLVAAVAPELGGAAYGAVAPVGSDETRLGNAAVGAGSALVGQGAGEAAKVLLRTGRSAITPAAQAAYALAQKYNIPITVPQLSDSTFLKHYTNLTDALPFSGADARYQLQRAAVNSAIAKESGVGATGAITPDILDAARDRVGSVIGDVAERNIAIPTQKNVADLNAVLADARANATPEVQAAVESKLKQIFARVNPQTGAIDGPAWRQANTALQRQIRSATDGDLKHYLSQIQEPFMDMMNGNMSGSDLSAWTTARGQYRNIKSIEPLVEKGGNEGLNPTLLRQRLIAAKNNRGNLSEIADLAQEHLKQRVPNSGTAQKNIIGTMTGLGAGGLQTMMHVNPMVIGGEAAVVGANSLANRILNSQLATKYYMGRLPDNLAKYANPAIDTLAAGAPLAAVPMHQDAEDQLDAAAHSGALVGQPPP